MKRILLLIFILLARVVSGHSQDIRTQLRQIANDLAKQIEAKGKKRVVIAAFLNLKNQETELGRYMADKFSIGLSSASVLEITDRSQLAQLLLDNKLGAERILDPKTIPNLGRITGADVIIIGNYFALDNSIDITVKAIELERGVRLAIAEGAIPRTSEINKLLVEAGSDGLTSPELTTSNSGVTENGKKDPDKKCSTNHTGTYCFQNTTKQDIRIQTTNANFTIHPGQTECNYGMSASAEGEQTYMLYIYKNTKESNYETRQIVVSECQVKTYIVR